MLHVHFPGHDDAPKKRFKRGTVNPPRVILDSPTTPTPVKKKPSLLLHNKRDLRPSKPQDEKPSVAVAVPTHNRIGYVQLTSKALRGTIPANDVWVFDDQSDEYKHKDLAAWYGTEHIFIAKRRLKADAMARHILEWFVSSQYDVLVLLDSDLVVAPNWLDSLHDGLRDSKGLLSLYRSGAPKHRSLRCGGVLCEQPSMGNAGTVWRRSIAEKMLSEMSNREGGFDWGWSEWCTKNKIPMEALRQSAVLHIGMHGSWSHETSAEKSVGFPMQTLSVDVRQRAEHFLKGAKPTSMPTKAAPTWQSFPNVWLPTYYQMAYANPEARTPNDLEKVKQTCIKLGCVAVTVEQNGWLAYFRNIPLDKSKWEPKSRSTMWVMSKYLVPTTKQPDMKYGCSRHAHACRRDPEPGSAPCCAHVMLEIMSDMSRVLRKHNIHWRLTQGQQLSVARDGMIQLWDHDFDPNIDQPEKAKAVIEQEMHLAGKASKYREADYYYTKRVAERLNTDWSKYKVMGGDFNWNLKEFHDPYALQRNPTFMDIGQNHNAKPTAETTFPCLPGYDILCSKRWFEETTAEFSSGYQRPPSGMPQEQIPYSGYVVGINNLMFGENGQERDAQSRDDIIRKYISDCPNFWEKPCLTSTKPPKSDILWVIPAFKRAWSLDLVLKSLSVHEAAKILVSKDADSAEIDSVLKKYTADVINHPWSCSRHPNQFPAKDDSLNENYKGDTYGNPRSPWATCLKHHWWWMMKQAWARKPERVCVVEDDTVIHPQAFEWLASQTGNVKLTPEEIAVPWCMSAREWQAIDPKTFCEHDDYNWDQTIAWMKEHGHGRNEASVPSVSLSMHVGDCGGWDAGGRDKACTPQKIVKIRANVEQWLGKPVAVNTIKKKWLMAHSKPNGGWGHPKDWAHCMGNDESKPFGMHFLERLEYYLPNRDYLFPTDVKSIEKKILTFDIPNRVSITFHAPVEKIAISTKNWPEKHKTQCPNCEFVNDRTATVKWVPGCPSNPRKDYKEQILVCSCGESQKGTGSSYFNSGIHQCDFDASFLNRDFQDAYTHLHLTPPQYKKILSVSDEMERYLEMPPMQEDKAVFIHSDCGHERGTFVSKMIQEGIFPIDRYGKCWRNKDIKTIEPSRENWYWGDSQGNRDTTKTSVFTNYKFSFALENTKSQDYFTEKRYQSFLALTVPIVWKNDNSEQYIPGENSVIYPEDHGNDSTELAEYLLRLTTDDKTYQKHMAWKKKGIRREFVKTLFKKTDFMACRICEKVSARQVSTGSKEYVVVMPSVKRNNDEYLIKTLDSLEKARPVDVPVLLVNANQPATKHTYLREWCSSHEKYKCIEPPQLSESLISDVISNDKRGDTPQYLRWRTLEATHAIFGMSEFLKTGAEYMIWLQDDVTIDEDLFSSLPKEEIVCLRSDGYCGMVAYMFKKSFVRKLIPKLKKNFKNMPIDWIVDQTRGREVIRIPKAYHHGIISSNGKTREATEKEAKLNAKAIQTADLFAAIDYNAPENKGPWKQGWDYEYDGRFKDGLTVHVVPHSHNDPGWIKTYHTYYSTQTKHILDTVVAALTEDPRRTFIWAEISYFSLWWNDATQQQKEQAKKLVAEKRLDFVTGGWVMNDEASVTARATRWHLQEGREWLQNTFGITPQYSWAIDPFGHSAGQAQVLKELGYKGMLIQRVHYAVKKQLAEKQQLEFQWQTPAGEIFTHMMPFYSYDGPHTCGPDPSICCQFDFARIGKGKTWSGCPWGKMAVPITDANVAERSRTWLDQVYKKAMLYRGKHVLMPLGDDFRYQTMDEAHKQFENYQKMFNWIKVNVPSVSISFSTLSRYFDAQRQTEVPSLQGSFFPYSDREKDYWTGYFNSRIFYKGYDRLLESLIAAVERKCPSESIHSEKRALGLFQHHDGITGTAKSAVVQDYYQTMQKAVESLRSKLKGCLSITENVVMNPLSIDTPTMKADEIRPLEEDVCVDKRIDFEKVRFDEHGILIEIDHTPVHETLVWRSNTAGPGVAGAYLMSVTSARDVLVSTSHSTCSTKYYKQMETVFDLVTRRVRVYNDGTLEIMYSVDIHARNNGELWAVYKPEWSAERLCSDVHGLTWECHKEREDAPLQAKFWPMPTMAWLASSSERLTFTGAQPTGVGFHEGAMVLMLDRRGDQDDARGLGQGITDSRPVDMRFGVLVETESLKEKASEKALSIRNWMLNPEIKLV